MVAFLFGAFFTLVCVGLYVKLNKKSERVDVPKTDWNNVTRDDKDDPDYR